jgi:mannose-6-phosphate isomerase-like protein (cupin superfamily)
MIIEKVNLADKLQLFSEHWSPKIAGSLNKQHVKLAKLKGDFVMHSHENEDELFLVLAGQLFIELEEQTICLEEQEFVIIPKGVAHRPYAPEEVSVLLFEPMTTLNTGNTKSKFTQTKLEEL